MDGSGFFAPVGGAVNFQIFPDLNIIEVIACKKNFG